MNPMAKTERLYYTDCYLREFEARVLRSEPAPNGFKVYLDRTAFYPTSGGQPTDSGTIAGMQVPKLLTKETKSRTSSAKRRRQKV